MAMKDNVSAETRLPKNVREQVDQHRKKLNTLHITDAVRDLIQKGIDGNGRDLGVPPRHVGIFDRDFDRFGFSVTKGVHAHVRTYAIHQSIDVREAYCEFIVLGLEVTDRQS